MNNSRSRTLLAGASVVLLAAALAGCSAAGSGSSTDTAAANSTCGVMKSVAPKDPDGVVAKLSSADQALYNGYQYTVRASTWADWKPKGSGPYTVGIVWATLVNSYQTDMLSAVQSALKSSPDVKTVITTTATSNDASSQIQQYNALVQKGVDLIIYQPSASAAFVAPVEQAAAQGIPSIAVQQSIPTADSVNVNTNQYVLANTAVSAMVKQIGTKGSVLGVHGVAGTTSDSGVYTPFTDAMKNCPNLKVVGNVTGNFDSGAAKTAVLQFLSSYSGTIDGVFQSAVMAPGIISAFQQDGLEVPTVTDIAAQQASLAYWRAHKKSYKGVGIGQSPVTTGNTIATIATRMLSGDGIKVSDVILDLPEITSDNLDQWADASWTTSSQGTASGPSDVALVSDAYLKDLFNSSN